MENMSDFCFVFLYAIMEIRFNSKLSSPSVSALCCWKFFLKNQPRWWSCTEEKRRRETRCRREVQVFVFTVSRPAKLFEYIHSFLSYRFLRSLFGTDFFPLWTQKDATGRHTAIKGNKRRSSHQHGDEHQRFRSLSGQQRALRVTSTRWIPFFCRLFLEWMLWYY